MLPPFSLSVPKCGTLPFIQWSHAWKTLRWRCRAVGSCSPWHQIQLCSANTTQTIWELFAQCWTELQMTAQHRQYFKYINIWHLPTTCHLLTEAQASLLHRILMLVCSSDMCGQIVSSWCRKLAQSPACKTDTKWTPATKTEDATALQSVPRDYVL